ncbi:hypothetical protein OIU78_022470 [Salix suchowensis]|nr:hypothetical protein OIU78_022470 [Salix suchowensis]
MRLYKLSVSSPALLHYFTNSAIVLPFSLAEHASSFRVCWGIWVWITEQRLGKTQNNLLLVRLLLVYTTSLEKLFKEHFSKEAILLMKISILSHQFQISNLLIADIRCILHLTIPLSNRTREK